MATSVDIEKALAACELFSALSPEHRQAIAGICRTTSTRKGDTLFLEGRPGAAMYLLASGSIQLFKASPDGREVVIRTVTPGGIFGEVVLFERDTYPVTAIARRNSTLYQISRSGFYTLLSREQFRNSFLAHLARRLRYLSD
ncbi:MAG: cyclic nucleotide-binding domain-containing protein, partial [bacterium]